TSTGTRSIGCLRRAIAVSPFANEKGPRGDAGRALRSTHYSNVGALFHFISFLGLFVNLRGPNVLSVLPKVFCGASIPSCEDRFRFARSLSLHGSGQYSTKHTPFFEALPPPIVAALPVARS